MSLQSCQDRNWKDFQATRAQYRINTAPRSPRPTEGVDVNREKWEEFQAPGTKYEDEYSPEENHQNDEHLSTTECKSCLYGRG